MSYAWSQDYKRREFVKFRHLLANTEQGDRSPVLSNGCKVQVRMKLKIFPSYSKNRTLNSEAGSLC